MKYIGACVVILIPLLFLHEIDLTVGVLLIEETSHLLSIETIRALYQRTKSVVSTLKEKVDFVSTDRTFNNSIAYIKLEDRSWTATERCNEEVVSDAYVEVLFVTPNGKP
eukprot:GHVU01146647.1.p3 GENE.GHVU01146647.1~~GHVU01146647.1.p3  ORF type:complete len:110 (-),score=7.35 GHVU01146647.1:87-416(-)